MSELRFLIDGSGKRLIALRERFEHLIAGQLITPLTRYAYLGGPFAIDNGAFSGFNTDAFHRLLDRQREPRQHCLWVAAPDVVGSGRRTLEAFRHWHDVLDGQGWPVALVAQDGLENLDVPWDSFKSLFVGGTTNFKMSAAAADLVRTAKILGKLVHIGRVNTPARFKHFAELGADTCDGSGIVRFDHMIEKVAALHFDDHPLLDAATPDQT